MSDETTTEGRDFSKLWDFGDPAATRERFRALLDEQADAAAAWRDEVTTQIARTLGLERRFDDARELLEQIAARWKEAAKAMPDRLAVRWNLERGRVENSSGAKEKARVYFERAFERAEDAGLSALAVDAAHMIAIAVGGEEGRAWNERALEMAESSDDLGARKWRGSLLNNLGWDWFNAEEYERALEHFERAVEVRLQAGKDRAYAIARWTVARAKRALDRFDEALAEQQALFEEAGEEEGTHSGYIAEEIAENLLAQGKEEEARPWFDKAWRLLKDDPWLAENEAARIARLEKLAKTANK